jgi:hypothetical protein
MQGLLWRRERKWRKEGEKPDTPVISIFVKMLFVRFRGFAPRDVFLALKLRLPCSMLEFLQVEIYVIS